MNKKEMFKKVKALLLAGTVGTTFTGCTINVDDDLLEKFGINVEVDSNGNININAIPESVQTTITSANTASATSTTSTTVAIVPTTEISYVSNVTEISPITTDVVTNTTVTSTVTESTTTSYENNVINERLVPNLYTIASKYESKGEYLYSILMKLYGNLDELENIKELNNLTNNYVLEGSVLLLPSTTVYYNVRPGDNIIDISNQTGISIAQLCKLNNFELSDTIVFDKDTKLLVKSLSKDSDSYMTNNGMAQIYQGNVFFADEYVSANNSIASSNCLLGLRNTPDSSNSVFIFRFSDNGDYTESVVAHNASRIGLIDGVPVVYVSDKTISFDSEYYLYNGNMVFSPIFKDLSIINCEKVSSKSK